MARPFSYYSIVIWPMMLPCQPSPGPLQERGGESERREKEREAEPRRSKTTTEHITSVDGGGGESAVDPVAWAVLGGCVCVTRGDEMGRVGCVSLLSRVAQERRPRQGRERFCICIAWLSMGRFDGKGSFWNCLKCWSIQISSVHTWRPSLWRLSPLTLAPSLDPSAACPSFWILYKQSSPPPIGPSCPSALLS